MKLSTQAYCKMVLHGAKYPHCAVNGLLVAEKQPSQLPHHHHRRERDPPPPLQAPHTLFVDCIPLFHGTLALAPMLEVALTLVSGRWSLPAQGQSTVRGRCPRAGQRPGQSRRPSFLGQGGVFPSSWRQPQPLPLPPAQNAPQSPECRWS